jgi:hypothetical protein
MKIKGAEKYSNKNMLFSAYSLIEGITKYAE